MQQPYRLSLQKHLRPDLERGTEVIRKQILIGMYKHSFKTWQTPQNCLQTWFCFSDFILTIIWDYSSWLCRGFFRRQIKNKCEDNKLKTRLSHCSMSSTDLRVLITESTLCCCPPPVHH